MFWRYILFYHTISVDFNFLFYVQNLLEAIKVCFLKLFNFIVICVLLNSSQADYQINETEHQ